jgi:hypothetical protein
MIKGEEKEAKGKPWPGVEGKKKNNAICHL